jgi:pyruvate dehydrogenase E1 component alpha subunit
LTTSLVYTILWQRLEEGGRGNTVAVAKEKLIEMYRTMVRIRTFEERVQKEFAAGRIGGFVHLYAGEEAVATGVCANLRLDDYVTSTHRGHGHVIAKGGKTDLMMAELYGKKTGYNKGKGGSMHIANVDSGMLGANAIVGAGIPIAGGAALSAKMRGTDQVCICFFGDGATNTTRFHEGINLASIWKLPVVYICENNAYAETTPITYAVNIPNIVDRATAYGIPGKTVDGNDVLAVYEAVGEAVAQARSGEGPTFIVCQTYRRHGHFEGDMQTYKAKEEVEEWMKKDPIPRFRKKLIEMGVLTEKEVDKIHREVEEEIEKSVKFAEESPYPDPEETLDDVYA